MVRPWDWTGIVLIRVCHDVCYFEQVTTCSRTQRNLLETFIDEIRNLIVGLQLITKLIFSPGVHRQPSETGVHQASL